MLLLLLLLLLLLGLACGSYRVIGGEIPCREGIPLIFEWRERVVLPRSWQNHGARSQVSKRSSRMGMKAIFNYQK